MSNINFDDSLFEIIRFKSYKQPPLPPIPNLSIGQEINHNRFGKGFVISSFGEKCNILFSFGTKELLSRFAEFN